MRNLFLIVFLVAVCSTFGFNRVVESPTSNELYYSNPLPCDENEDGGVDFPELQICFPGIGELVFIIADSNGDGFIDEDELVAACEAQLLNCDDLFQ